MKTFVNSVTRWDIVFATAIFGFSGRKLLSFAMPWISHTGNGYYYPTDILAGLVIGFLSALIALIVAG